MMYRGLSPGLRIKPEERLSITFANECRALALDGHLRAVFCHPANELIGSARSGATAAVTRAMGLIPGAPDFWFMGEGRNLALEAKAGKGTQSQNQKDFETWCAASGVPYRLFTTVDEGLGHLRDAGLLL
jgi:hypothetical protein